MVENLNFSIPFNNPSIDNIDEIHHYLYEKFSLRQNDSLLIVPITEGKNVYEI
jgi:hypothetical protein